MAVDLTSGGVFESSVRLNLAAWAHASATGTFSIYVDDGVSSMTDGGTGDVRFNLSPDLGTNAYAAVSDCEANSKSAMNTYAGNLAQVLVRTENAAYSDNNHVFLLIGGGGTA